MKTNDNDQKPVKGSETGNEWDKNREASGSAGTSGPNDSEQHTDQTDSGQGAPGVQGQYAGNNDQPSDDRPGKTAPHRADPDTMNQNGSSQVALGSRERDKFGNIVGGGKEPDQREEKHDDDN
jgi:hypothetical protein